jgi:hypothetical protein
MASYLEPQGIDPPKQCSLPTFSLRVLRSSLYCRLSSDLHSFRFCARRVCSRVLGFPNLTGHSTGRLFLSGEALLTGVTLQEYTRRYMLHHFSEERSLKRVLFPGSFTVSLVERGEGA